MSNHDDSAIGATIKRFREAQNVSQAQVAEEMSALGLEGIYPQTIAKIEAGTRGLKFGEGILLAHVMGVEPGSFFNPRPFDDLRLKARALEREIRSAEETYEALGLERDQTRARLESLRANLAQQLELIAAEREAEEQRDRE